LIWHITGRCRQGVREHGTEEEGVTGDGGKNRRVGKWRSLEDCDLYFSEMF